MQETETSNGIGPWSQVTLLLPPNGDTVRLVSVVKVWALNTEGAGN